MANTDFDAAEHFGENLSAAYDERIREIIPGYEAMHEIAKHLLQEHIPEAAHVLVAGSGTCHESISYALSNPKWNIVGFDPSSDMHAVAREKLKPLHLESRVRLIHGSIEDVNTDLLFDCAVSILVMQFLPDDGSKQHYLNEISRRLRQGAQIILIDLEGAKYSSEFNMLLSAWKSHQYANRKDAKQVDRDFQHVDENPQFAPEERIRELLHRAGFSGVCKFYKSLLFGGYIAAKEE